MKHVFKSYCWVDCQTLCLLGNGSGEAWSKHHWNCQIESAGLDFEVKRELLTNTKFPQDEKIRPAN